jgi:hypothetical protein
VIIIELAYSFHLGSDKNKRNTSRSSAKSNKSGSTSLSNNAIQNSAGLTKVDKQIYEILNNQTDYHDGGYYKVGVDIPAGQYVLESYGSGYWAVMTGPVGSSDIVDNDNFNGRASVNVRDGQYLTISRSSYTKQ